MDNILEEKLRNFSTLVMADARKKSDEITREAESEKQKKLKVNEDKILNNAYNIIQSSVLKYDKEDNERVLHAEVEAKKRILKKREEIVDRVFESVAEKLDAFVEGDDYEAWLEKLCAKAAEEIGGSGKTVYLTSRDMKYADKISAAAGGADVKMSSENFIGGIKMESEEKHISVDYSLKSLSENEKNNFIQNAGLSID